ncbi:hypothetical protein HMPREF1549_02341 [Actinomyces johnsonii F0510]|uniref:Uncharacterized protein n=1 Tax=Actinomyces johnsonii F0510 TaxID=1227262 RepID=U1RDT9_9ACTO|nr:hypothetical protein HMPREF1549_02341 [Actinomyces johnsonii F0510]
MGASSGPCSLQGAGVSKSFRLRRHVCACRWLRAFEPPAECHP